jgi:hypothetical protein
LGAFLTVFTGKGIRDGLVAERPARCSVVVLLVVRVVLDVIVTRVFIMAVRA